MPLTAALKILIVDDQNSVRQMTKMTLEQIGVRHFHEAENGKQVMDGLEFLRALRGHPVARKLPFILLTGRGDQELVVKAAQAGANNYLIKPFTPAILKEKIEQVVGKLS